MRREVVQRFFRPALGRELVDQLADDAEVFGLVAELAGRDGVEEQRFALSRRLLDVRLDAVARVARPLQEVVALGEPQLDNLAIVSLRRMTQALECRARLWVSLGAEQPLGATELQLVAVRARRDRRNRQTLELGARERRQIAEWELVHEAREGFGGFRGVARRFGRSPQPHQNVFRRGRLRFREALVDLHGGSLIAQRLVALRFA